MDTEVRRTWQIGAERVHIGGLHWERTLESIVAKAAAGLGVEGTVEAELYKLLVYDQGSFFVDHRDTEKAPGMFATLVCTKNQAGFRQRVEQRERKLVDMVRLEAATA